MGWDVTPSASLACTIAGLLVVQLQPTAKGEDGVGRAWSTLFYVIVSVAIYAGLSAYYATGYAWWAGSYVASALGGVRRAWNGLWGAWHRAGELYAKARR